MLLYQANCFNKQFPDFTDLTVQSFISLSWNSQGKVGFRLHWVIQEPRPFILVTWLLPMTLEFFTEFFPSHEQQEKSECMEWKIRRFYGAGPEVGDTTVFHIAHPVTCHLTLWGSWEKQSSCVPGREGKTGFAEHLSATVSMHRKNTATKSPHFTSNYFWVVKLWVLNFFSYLYFFEFSTSLKQTFTTFAEREKNVI